MTFAEALQAIKDGYRVAHRDWEETNSFLVIDGDVIKGVYPDREVIWTPTQQEILSDEWKYYGHD